MDHKLVVLPIAAFFAILPLVPSQKAPSVSPAEKTERILSSVLPKRMGEGSNAMTLASAKAEGDVLVMRIDAPGGTGFSGDEMTRMLTAGICTTEGLDRLFRHGIKLRFDVSVEGQVTQGATVDGCGVNS